MQKLPGCGATAGRGDSGRGGWAGRSADRAARGAAQRTVEWAAERGADDSAGHRQYGRRRLADTGGDFPEIVEESLRRFGVDARLPEHRLDPLIGHAPHGGVKVLAQIRIVGLVCSHDIALVMRDLSWKGLIGAIRRHRECQCRDEAVPFVSSLAGLITLRAGANRSRFFARHHGFFIHRRYNINGNNKKQFAPRNSASSRNRHRIRSGSRTDLCA